MEDSVLLKMNEAHTQFVHQENEIDPNKEDLFSLSKEEVGYHIE